jgi:hypothetical protein
LTSNVTELDEIVISPNHTAEYIESILNKAIQNLFLNFQKEKTQTYYLVHVKKNATTGGEKELYALIEITLTKVNVKKTSCKLKFNLRQIDRTKDLNDNDFKIKGKFVSTQFFPDIEFQINDKKKANTLYELHENDNHQLIIKASPKYPDKNNYNYSIYTISKQDTILTGILGQSHSNSNELTQTEFKGISNHISNHFHNINFKKDVASGLYYPANNLQHLISLKVMTDTPYEITSHISIQALANVSPDDIIKNKERIYRTSDYLLFQSKLPDTPGFWKKYVNH